MGFELKDSYTYATVCNHDVISSFQPISDKVWPTFFRRTFKL